VRSRSLLVAIVAFACFVSLGMDVVQHGEPPSSLAWEHSLLDRSTLVAWWLTWFCYMDVLAPIAVGLLIIAWLVPAWRARIIFSIVALLLCWRGADLFQHIFARPRPLDWVVKHETSFSYPSSHAAIATGFYALWAVMLYRSELPRWVCRIGGSLLMILAVAICWSRLALGAHYLTDLAGGALLGIALVSAAWAAVPVRLTRPVAGRLQAAAE
jgi:membrane-associated phospholipid phosphatase